MSSRARSPAIKLAKFLVFVINFVGLLFGIILISIGAYVYNSKSSIVASLAYSELDTGLIVLGIFVCLLSFVGAFGAKKEIAVLLKVYFALLCILVGIQIIVGLTAFASRAQTATVLNKGWDEAYQKNHLLILDVERSFECCGFTTTADRAVPATCVKETGRTNSCFDSMALSFDNYLHVIGVTGSVFGGMEILSLLLSFVLFKKIKQLAVDMHNDRLLEEAQKLEMSGKLSV